MKNIRPLWWISGLVVVMAIVGFIWMNNAGAGKLTYRFDKVDRGDIVVSISATGTLNAVTTVQVGSQVSGTIAKLYADFNSVVKEGQLLAQLDPTFLQATVNEQRANMDRASAQVHEAQRNYDRTTDLFAKLLVSQADMDAATTTLESAKASLQQARAALDRAQVNLRYATIRAPISGVVVSRNVDVGQTVAASLQAPTLFTIANDLRKMQVQASVDEADIGNVKVGQTAGFRVDAFPDEEFNGLVSQIRLAPTITQNVVTYTVIVDVDNPRQKLMPGMTATLSIEVERRDNVLRLPVQSINFKPPEEELDKLPSEDPRSGERRDTTRTMGQQRFGQGERRGRQQGGWEQDGRRNRAGGGGEPRRPRGGMMNEGRIWVLDDGTLKPIKIVRGLQNTQYVELVEPQLNEGAEVIIGVIGIPAVTSQTSQNPFMPQQMPRGARRGF